VSPNRLSEAELDELRALVIKARGHIEASARVEEGLFSALSALMRWFMAKLRPGERPADVVSEDWARLLGWVTAYAERCKTRPPPVPPLDDIMGVLRREP